MGVKHLWPHALPDLKNKTPFKHLLHYKGQSVAVDISGMLHAIIRSESVCLYMSCDPPYPPPHFERVLHSRYKTLMKYFDKVTFVFDGSRHTMKSVARANRNNTINDAKAAIEEFYKKCNATPQLVTTADRGVYMSSLKSYTTPDSRVISLVTDFMRKEGIPFITAPVEAEWQLSYLEKAGLANTIISVDGDCIILGIGRVIFEIDWQKELCKEYNHKCIVEKP